MQSLSLCPASETSNAQALSRKCRLLFLDENGQPSERSGPDLRREEPIDQLVSRLRRLRAGHPLEFYRACQASGIHLSVTVAKDGRQSLGMGLPCDNQERLRRDRYRALADHFHSTDRRRQDVLELVNFLGHFADNQPYASVREAADKLLAAGGRIYILADGRCEEVLPYSEKDMISDSWEGYPTRRMAQRYQATLRQRGARDEMKVLVCANGKLHAGSGSTVWELDG